MPITRSIGQYYEERWSHAAWWGRRFAVFSFLLLFVATAAHRFAYLETIPFFWVLAVVFGFAVLALLLAAIGFQPVWHKGFRGGGDLGAAVLLGLVVLAPFAISGLWAYGSAPLWDISTDLDDPPTFNSSAAFRTPDMNALALPDAIQREAQFRAYPEITGRRYAAGVEQVSKSVEALIERNGWQLVSPLQDDTDREITFEAIAKLPVLALPYDIAIRVTDEGNATYVDMRSASRYGSRDLGINANRIMAFLDELDVMAESQIGVTPPADEGAAEPPDEAPIPEQLPEGAR